MALQIETIRATADRVAASHHLDVVDLEFTGGAKHRTLRVFLEKDAPTRERLTAESQHAESQSTESQSAESQSAAEEESALPKGVPIEMLSFVTHEDCAGFATDFGTVLDVEDLIPGADYTLEVSSPGLERKLFKPADYTRFTGSLVKLQLFTAIESNRQFTGRLTAAEMTPAGMNITLDLAAIKQKGKAKKASATHVITIPLANVEKAQLVAEI